MVRCTPACTKEDFEASHFLYIFCMSNPNILGTTCRIYHIDGFVHDCSISIANALEILQSWYVCSNFAVNIYLRRYPCIWKHEVTIWHSDSKQNWAHFGGMIISHSEYVSEITLHYSLIANWTLTIHTFWRRQKDAAGLMAEFGAIPNSKVPWANMGPLWGQ